LVNYSIGYSLFYHWSLVTRHSSFFQVISNRLSVISFSQKQSVQIKTTFPD